MAVGRPNSDLGVHNLEKEIECPICQEHYDDPRVLPCLHYYCKKCIHSLAFGKGATGSFVCPECRTKVILTEKELEELRPAFFMNRFKTTILSTLGLFFGKSRVKMAECSIHQEPLKLYCSTCKQLICRDCVLKDHKDCDYEFVSKLAPEARESLLEQVSTLKHVELNLNAYCDAIEATMGKVKSKGDTTAQEIRSCFDDIRQIVDEREQEVLIEAEHMVKSKVDALLKQKDGVAKSSVEVRSILEQVEACANRSSDAEVVANRVSFLSKVEQATKLQSNHDSMELPEKLSIETKLDCHPALQKLLLSEVRIGPEEANPGRSTVLFKTTKFIKVGEFEEAILVVKNADGSRCEKPCDVSSHLTCLRTGEVTECDIESSGHGRHFVRFMPSNRGRHTLTVLLNGMEVGKSPFSIFVRIHPKQLGRPVDEWPDFVQVTGIAANSAGEIIVAEESREISVLDFAGKKIRSVDSSDHKLKSAYHVAVDEADNVYIGDYLSNRIYTCDKELKNQKVWEIPVIKKGRRGMAVSKDEVFVCEQNVIKVFDKSFTLVRQLTSDHLTLPRFICADEGGLLYITDKHKAAVQVFRNSTLLRSVGLGEGGEQHLPNPLGVCVFGSHMYVTDYTKSCVSVFTTEGEFVTSFGQKGSDPGCFYLPHGICVDRDGYVYVADRSNNRVQVF